MPIFRHCDFLIETTMQLVFGILVISIHTSVSINVYNWTHSLFAMHSIGIGYLHSSQHHSFSMTEFGRLSAEF